MQNCCCSHQATQGWLRLPVSHTIGGNRQGDETRPIPVRRMDTKSTPQALVHPFVSLRLSKHYSLWMLENSHWYKRTKDKKSKRLYYTAFSLEFFAFSRSNFTSPLVHMHGESVAGQLYHLLLYYTYIISARLQFSICGLVL